MPPQNDSIGPKTQTVSSSSHAHFPEVTSIVPPSPRTAVPSLEHSQSTSQVGE